MKRSLQTRLWVIKFCIRVVYPNYNFHLFCVFLAIKYRLYLNKVERNSRIMELYQLRSISQSTHRLLCKDYLTDNLPVLWHKCLVISREQYIQLAAENLFYLDNGLLWVALKLSPNQRKRIKTQRNDSKDLLIYNLEFLTKGFNKKQDDVTDVYNKMIIVPVVGSKHIKENVVFCTENEHSNLNSTFNTTEIDEIEVTFHPVPSLDNAPKISAAAEVNLLENDYDLANDFVKDVLSNYFYLPKLFHVGDVFSIDLKPEITGKQHYKYADLVSEVGKLYFKVKKLSSDIETITEDNTQVQQPYYIVKGVTQLTLGDSIHLLRPKDEYFPVEESVGDHKSVQNCPTGLKSKFDQIQEAVAPFVHGDMNDLVSSLSSPIIPMLLITGALGSGRHLIVKCIAKYNGLNCLNIDCNALQSSTAKQTESKISATIQKAKAAAPCIVLLDNFEIFAVDAENNEDCRVIEFFVNTLKDLYQNYTKHAIIFTAISEKTDLNPNILRIFLEKIHISKPNTQQRFEMLQWFASTMNLDVTSSKDSGEKDQKNWTEVLERTAAKTETFQYGDLDTLVHFAVRESYLRQQESTPDLNMHRLHEDDLNSALESMRKLQSQHLDAPKIPKVQWEDIGGLDKLKKELLKTIEFPIKYPHLFKNSTLKRSGILLYGPPGCGKTLVAKAVSTELNVSFLSVKGPELLNMYIGQSEENVRKVFESARASAPCIVFLDELDALAARRGSAGDSGGAGDRVVSQLLAELDGVTSHSDADSSRLVFVMGATNRPDLLEQSLLRPGRLDKLVYVGPYEGLAEKTCVLTALCRKYRVSGEVELRGVAGSLPERVTGADLRRVCDVARAAAVRALVGTLARGLIKETELSVDSVVLTPEDFAQGLRSFRPSVTDEEMAYYESLQHTM